MMRLKQGLSIRYVLPLCLLGLLGFILSSGLQQDPSDLPSALLNKPLPNLYIENVLTGKPELINHRMKGKIALLNVWAPWCQVCQKEQPILEQLAKLEGIALFSLVYKDTPEQVFNSFNKHGNPYQQTWLDPTGEASLDLGIYGTPELYIIDQQGYIRYRHAGLITQEILTNKILPIIKQLSGTK